jgi:vacuolar-type H+-ATPase subunit I/STV1
MLVLGIVIGFALGYALSLLVYISQVSELESVINFLQTDLDDKNSEITDLQSLINQKDSEISSLSMNLGAKNLQINYLTTSLNKKNEEIDELKSMVRYEINVKNDKDYYNSLKDDIRSSEKTILIAMYYIKYQPSDGDNSANDLLMELVNAKERGIEVTVFVENRTFDIYEVKFMEDNQKAINYLLNQGLNVKVDNENDTDHMKLVIIDDEIVYVGSHNWTESGLTYNSETSVRIVSEEIATAFRDYFNSLLDNL